MEFSHVPVMLEECIEGLNLKDGGIYFDGTIGGAGHSYEILKRTSPCGKLIATDLDDDAIAAATKRLAEFKNRYSIYKSDYKNFQTVFTTAGVDKIDGAILDFGVSSYQLDNAERGFSYMKYEAPLDMRMDRSQPLTAEKLINEYPQREIAEILKKYGEEKFASDIAAGIVKARTRNAITTCGALVEIIENCIPKKFQQNGPAARKSFQAIRIAVNGELSGLYECVVSLTRKLAKGGRIVILTFHSLEDRIVKQAFRFLETDCICDKSLPVCVCGKQKEIEIITKKPVIASVKEMAINSRSKCAKLRIAEKIV
ncbi:MAG: 16S rRNA (cytosine(1402)-N(4))-methyltransferase RsmH [Clostridia bacterium]|nr:16S rRNA (cytosine(1402)-N(4))-methyltransferase RsmH [Clostridia bacterium]